MWGNSTGFLQECEHDIRAAVHADSDDAIVLLRNVLLDPVYLDLVLFLFSSARYNSIVYHMESYLWIRTTPGSSAAATLASVPIEMNITRQMRSSVLCSLVLESALLLSPAAHKTDLYNISKVRSYIHTSLQTFGIHNIDIIARPRHVSIFLHDSLLNETAMVQQMALALRLCIPPHKDDPAKFSSNRYIQHAVGAAPSIIVTEIVVLDRLCPSALELDCMRDFTGDLIITPDATCVADIDILFTASSPDQLLSTFEQYIAQIQGYDTGMRLERNNPCAEVLYVRHKASSTEYAHSIAQLRTLSELHAIYNAQFQGAVLFDSGVHTLGIYNVTMRLGSQLQAETTQSALALKLELQQQTQQKTHLVRVLKLLGVHVEDANVGTPCGMSLRQDSTNDDGVIFTVTGTVLSVAEITTLVNTTMWLVTSRFAGIDQLVVGVASSTISGSLVFEALSVAQAQALCAHVQTYKHNYTPDTSPLFYATVVQEFIIPSHLHTEGIAVQEHLMQTWVRTSSYTFRVTIRIPIEVSKLNKLLVEVIKTIIFNKASSPHAVLTSLSGQSVVLGDGQSSPVPNSSVYTEYAFMVYEMPVQTVQDCDISHNANSENYFLEIQGVVSGLFGVTVGFEMHSACLVENTLHRTERHSNVPQCGGLVCNDGVVALYAAAHAFLNHSSVAYGEKCQLHTTLTAHAQFEHVGDSSAAPADVQALYKTLMYGHTASKLNVVMLASIRILDNDVDPGRIEKMFSSIYTSRNHSNNDSSSSVHPTADGVAGFFSRFNDGMSAREKTSCVRPSHEMVLLPMACMQNLSISQFHGDAEASCLLFSTLNSRINLNTLRRFIMSKTTPEMLQTTAISMHNQLDARVESMPCTGGVPNLVKALIQSGATASTHFDIVSKHSAHVVLVVQHGTPFVPIADYQAHVLRLFLPDKVVPTEWQMSTSAELHLHTKGVSLGMAMTFFQMLMQEYIRSQLPTSSTVTVSVAEMQEIQQFTTTFPGTLYEPGENRVQLYVRVLLHGLRDCAEIQPIITLQVVQQQFYGVVLQATIVDDAQSRVTCNNSVQLEYNSLTCTSIVVGPLASRLVGLHVAGGVVVSNHASCSQGGSLQCSAHLSSSDTDLFYAMLRILTTDMHQLFYYFEHVVRFCGLDAGLLGELISAEALDFFGEFATFTPLPSFCQKHPHTPICT